MLLNNSQLKLSHQSFENWHSNDFAIELAFHVNEIKKLKISQIKTKVDFILKTYFCMKSISMNEKLNIRDIFSSLNSTFRCDNFIYSSSLFQQ